MIFGTVPFPNRLEQLQAMYQNPHQLNRDYIETYLRWNAWEQEGWQHFINLWRGIAS